MSEAPSWLTAQLLVSAVVVVVFLHVLLAAAGIFIYFERKISAYIQDRLGPNRVGFDLGFKSLSFLRGMWGLGQSLADGIKMLLKEDFTPAKADKVMFFLAPGFMVIPALIGFLIIPWGGVWQCPDIHVPILGWTIPGGPVHVSGANISVGIVYTLAVAAVGVYGIALGGWAANNKYSFLGGLRASAQMISYEIPMGLALLTALVVMGTVMPDGIIRHQQENGWLIFAQPIAAVIFFIAMLAEANRAPFDNAECEQELVGGYHTEYSSMRFALYPLAEYVNMFVSSCFFALVFLGGYQLLPFVNVPLTSPDDTGLLAVLAKVAIFAGKGVLLVGLIMLVRWTLPRLRYDQIMMMAWQMVIPLMLVVVVVMSVLVYFDLTAWYWGLAANAAIAVGMIAMHPLLPEMTANRRVPIYGSRFSPMAGERVRTQSADPAALEDRPVQGSMPV